MPSKVVASVLTGPRSLVTREFPFPEVSQDSMIVKIEMCGVCGTDVHVYDGYQFSPVHPMDLPLILGHENVGRIYKIGDHAASEMEFRGQRLREGDRVVWYPQIQCKKCYFCRNVPQETQLCMNAWSYGFTNCERPQNKPWLFGGYSEYVFIRPGTFVWKVREDIPLEAVVMLDTVASVRGVEKAMIPFPNVKEGFGFMDNVVILGDGPVGICTAAKARAMGAGTIMLSGHHQNRLKAAEEFGVDIAIGPEYKNTPEKVKEKIMDLTEGVGADVVFNCAGIPDSFADGLRLTRVGGIYVEIGNATDRGTVPINPTLDLCLADRVIIGQFYCPAQQYNRDLRFIESMRFPFEKLVSHRFRVSEAADAMHIVSNRQAIKAVIVP